MVIVAIAIGGALYAQSMPTTRQVTVQGFDFFFLIPGNQAQNPTVTVKTGDTIVLTLQNMGSKNDHEFFILDPKDYNNYLSALASGQNASEPKPAFPSASVEDVPAGQSKTGTFVVGQPGTYVYACLDKEGTEPLTHAHKGMYGTFVVESSGLFGLTKTLGGATNNIFSNLVTGIPSIAIWQAAIIISLVVLARRRS